MTTPYPGTEIWFTDSRRLTSLDYRLFDVQHAVVPTRLPLHRFYEELVKTQAVLSSKHLGFAAMRGLVKTIVPLLLRGQTNFATSLWKWNRVFNPARQYGDHSRPVTYAMRPPAAADNTRPLAAQLYIHAPAAGAKRLA